MDCFFHSNVPSVAPCTDCGKPICATCRDTQGACPSCRLAAKINAASAARQGLTGKVPPRSEQAWHTQQQQHEQWQQQQWQQQQWQAEPSQHVAATAHVEPPEDAVESRAIVALGFPLFPLALISLFDRKQSRRLRRQAYQALGFNLGMAGFYALLTLLAYVPFIQVSAGMMLALFVPVFMIASIYFGIKVWHGDDVRVPIITDWLDDRIPA